MSGLRVEPPPDQPHLERPADSDVAIELRGLAKEFTGAHGSVLALDHVSLDIQRGEFLCIVGPSGCGKTTLLNIVGGLTAPSAGTASINVVDPARPALSIVFQEQGVFPWLTVLDNAAFGLMARGVGLQQRHAIARTFLSKMGLIGFERAYPRQLSGGMKQRVNLARAFANDPEILLMDEPFASLDEQTKLIMQDELLRIWEGTNKTVLFITHSLDEAVRLADRVIVMTARPGKIKADIPVDLARPRHVMDMPTNPDFVRLHAEVWRHLRDEVLAAQEIHPNTIEGS